MNITLVSPDSLREFTVEWIDVRTTEGHRIIMHGHAPLIAQLTPQQTISMKLPGGAVKSLLIPGGIMNVNRTEVIIILEA